MITRTMEKVKGETNDSVGVSEMDFLCIGGSRMV